MDRDRFEHLYYSQSDGIAFWVIGYLADNTAPVLQFADLLKQYAEEFAGRVGVDAGEVNTTEVYESRRFKMMRVFYARVAACPPAVTITSQSMGDVLRV